jgi:hypothetical protein
MTPIQTAILLMRILSIAFITDVIEVLTELPADIYGVFSAQSNYAVSQRELALVMALIRLFFYVSIATGFLFFARPLAKLFTKGLESKHDDAA